jgi:hypothetical protein
MMNFFERVVEPVPPRNPIEGMFKLLFLSQIITVPITLSTDFNNREEVVAKSLVVNSIHLLALFIGLMWGAINADNIRDEAPRNIRRK